MSSGSVPPPPGASGAPAPPSVSRKLIWIIVSVVVAVALLAVLFVGGIATAVFSLVKSSEPYQHGLQMATHDPRVIAELGAPLQPGWLVNGSIQTSGPSGSADIAIPLNGSRMKGTLYVVAKKSAGQWTYQTLELRTEGQPDIDLLRPSNPSPEVR